MKKVLTSLTGQKVLDVYFLENRARLLEIAAFIERIERAKEAHQAREDFRYKALMKALRSIISDNPEKTKTVQLIFSDTSKELIDSAQDLIAVGAWPGFEDEDH